MTATDYAAILTKATFGPDTTTESGTEHDCSQARLTMAAHFLFDRTRLCFLPAGVTDRDRVFGLDTRNEQFYHRTGLRLARMPASARRQAARILAQAQTLDHLPPDDRPEQAHLLIGAVEQTLEAICVLGLMKPDPAMDWITRRPAF